MPYWIIAYGLSALLVTALLTLLAKQPALSIGLVDRPGGRKQHATTVPLCGGPAIVVAFLLLVAIFGALPSMRYLGLLGGVVLLALVGCWDDLRDLSARRRFVAQALVVLLCMEWFAHARLASLGDLFGGGEVGMGLAAIPFTVFCVVGLVNAMNLVDGIDGLAGGLAVIALTCFAGVALAAGRFALSELLMLLIGGTIGFLLFNLRTPWRQRASVFLGDSGSTVLGFILCWFAVDLTQGRAPAIAPITAVWIMALPVMDTVSVMLGRALRGDRPFSPSREHLHHVMLALGYSPRRAVHMLLAFATALSGVGLAGEHFRVPESMMCLGFIGLWGIYFGVMQHFWRQRYARFVSGFANTATRPTFSEFILGPYAATRVVGKPEAATLTSFGALEGVSDAADAPGDVVRDPIDAAISGLDVIPGTQLNAPVMRRQRDQRMLRRSKLG